MTIFKIVTSFGVFFTETEYLCIGYDYTTDDAIHGSGADAAHPDWGNDAVAQHCGFADHTVLQRTFKNYQNTDVCQHKNVYLCKTKYISMPQEQSHIRERQKTDLREPRRYKVIIHNDDFTTMDFVVKVLREVFYLSDENAEALMLQVHHSNKAVVGIYTYDIAVSKAQKATNMARENGYPLRLTVEPEDN